MIPGARVKLAVARMMTCEVCGGAFPNVHADLPRFRPRIQRHRCPHNRWCYAPKRLRGLPRCAFCADRALKAQRSDAVAQEVADRAVLQYAITLTLQPVARGGCASCTRHSTGRASLPKLRGTVWELRLEGAFRHQLCELCLDRLRAVLASVAPVRAVSNRDTLGYQSLALDRKPRHG